MRRPSVRALLWACLCLGIVPLSLFTLGQSTPDALSSRRCFTEAELTALRVAPSARPTAMPPLRLERNMWQGHYLSTAAAAILLKEANGFDTLIEDTDGQSHSYGAARRGAVLRCAAPPNPRHHCSSPPQLDDWTRTAARASHSAAGGSASASRSRRLCQVNRRL